MFDFKGGFKSFISSFDCVVILASVSDVVI